MGLFDIFKSRRKSEEQFLKKREDFIKKIKEAEGTELDELPGSTGEFGFSPNNPILLVSIPESRNYLEKLIFIKPGSSSYSWVRVGSLQNDIVQAPIDKYNLIAPDENIIKTIYIWPYNRVNSKIVPEGFGLMD